MRWIALLALVAGCKVGPDYKKPTTESKVPAGFKGVDDPAFKAGTENLEKWWEVFNDPQLTDLIERAAKQNLDIRIAIARVNEARARISIAESARSPQVGVGGGGGYGGFAGSAGAAGGGGIGASWELDVFGQIARQVEAATADFQATVEQQRDVNVSLYAEVAAEYLAVRTAQERLAAAERNIQSQREILDITRVRFANGLSSRLDVAQAERVLADSETTVPPLRIALVRSINSIGVLLGKFPKDLHEELRAAKPIPVPPRTIAIGVPANIIRQRPDIRGAERRLAAETARVGVAKGDLYPKFSLGGSFAYGAAAGNQFLNSGASNFFLGPSMRWSLFNGGRVRSEIKVADYRVEQAVLTYESTVLRAMEEVETAMADFTQSRVRADAFERAANVAREELDLGLELYKQGLIAFQNILDAQRALFLLDSRVSLSRGNASTSLVRLYKALGGGWDPDKVKPPDPDKFDKQPDGRRTLEDDTTYQGGDKADG